MLAVILPSTRNENGSMYTPKQFAMDDPAEIHAHVLANPFGCIVSTDADGAPIGTHMPFVLDTTRNVLMSHMARANSQWQTFAAHTTHTGGSCGPEVLVIFSGPHCYVSPRWYQGDFNVPTWNYTAVHAYGKPSLITEPARVREILDELVADYERSPTVPWRVDWTDERNRKLTNGIVVFEIAVTRWEGKQKLSQNKAADDRAGVEGALRQSERAGDQAIAALMARQA